MWGGGGNQLSQQSSIHFFFAAAFICATAAATDSRTLAFAADAAEALAHVARALVLRARLGGDPAGLEALRGACAD